MTDREFLELAAKAAGYEVLGDRHPDDGLNVLLHGRAWVWRPQHDDGDALRLAVALGIQIGDYHQYGRALAFMGTTRGSGEFWEIEGTPDEATRRAIVRAAAEIGKAKP
jgi:hypothetical protein